MNKTKFFLCIAAVIIVAIAAAGFYTASLNDAVDVNMMVNVDELMRHDLNTINGHIKRTWLDLEYMCRRIELAGHDSVLSARKQLNHECITSRLEEIYLIDDRSDEYSSEIGAPISSDGDFERFSARAVNVLLRCTADRKIRTEIP